MLACLALVAALSVNTTTDEIPALTAEIEAQARELAIETRLTPELLTQIDHFSNDTARLSRLLQGAGVRQDMPCLFRGIAKDARARATEFIAASNQTERDAAFMNLRVLMDDAALMAPLAATAAQDAAQDAQGDFAQR